MLLLFYDYVLVNESDGLKLGFLFDLGCNYHDKEFLELIIYLANWKISCRISTSSSPLDVNPKKNENQNFFVLVSF